NIHALETMVMESAQKVARESAAELSDDLGDEDTTQCQGHRHLMAVPMAPIRPREHRQPRAKLVPLAMNYFGMAAACPICRSRKLHRLSMTPIPSYYAKRCVRCPTPMWTCCVP